MHTLGGVLERMYGRHRNGLLELELGDWKYNRGYRIMSFDNGLFSFKDFRFWPNTARNDLHVLITNPKDAQFKTGFKREPLEEMRLSSHIRFLVFSRHQVTGVKVYIDTILFGVARKVNDSSPLYVIKWNSRMYEKGVHSIKVVVEVNKSITYYRKQLF